MPLTNHSGRQSRPHFRGFLKKETGSIRKDSIMEDKKRKQSYWLRPSLVLEMESMLGEANAKSKSDFVTQAIDFYIGYLGQKKCVDFISPILAQSIKSEIGSVEHNISKMLFKLSVEQSILNNLIAFQSKVNPESLETLRNSCAEEVARLGGVVTFEDAHEWRHGE